MGALRPVGGMGQRLDRHRLRLVGDALHHQQVTTTARYARLMPGRLEQGVDRVAAAFERAALLPATDKKDKTA